MKLAIQSKNFILMLCVFLLSTYVTVFATSVQEFHSPEYISSDIAKISGKDENLGNLIELIQARDGSIREIYSLTDPEEIQRRLINSNHPFSGEDIYEIKTIIVTSPQNEYTPTEERILSSLSLRNLSRSQRWYFPDRPLRTSSYVAPGGTMTINESVAVTWNASVSVPLNVLTAQLGFSHTNTHSVSDAQHVQVDPGHRAYVTAWTLHERTTFDIYRVPLIGNATRDGNGRSYRPNGVRFDVIIR